MTNTPQSLREQLKALKPHSTDQLPLGDLLSEKELDAILAAVLATIEAARLPKLPTGTDEGDFVNYENFYKNQGAKAQFEAIKAVLGT